MKKVISKIGLGFLVFMFIAGFNKTSVMAASGSVSVGGGGNVTVGDTVNVTVSVNADETLYGVDIGISYDAGILEYVSGAGVGGGGTARIAEGANGTSMSYTLTFKAISAGSSNVSVSNAIGVTDAEFQMSGGSTSVTVNAPSTASANNSLSSLQISPGTLSPAFSSKTLNYSATVANSVTKIAVTATPQDSSAQVTGVSGSGDLSVGVNTVRVVVTAENGATATYTIKVTREGTAASVEETPDNTQETPDDTEETPDNTEEPEDTRLEAAVGSQILYVYDDFSEGKIPEGFEKTKTTYNGKEINAVQDSTGEIILVYLVDENTENGAFYIYDEATGAFSEFVEVMGTTGRYIILVPDATVAIPAGYAETVLELDGKNVKAWILGTDVESEFYLVYVMNGNGEKGFYQYDTVEGTFQRFVENTQSVIEETPEESTDEDDGVIISLQEELAKTNQDHKNALSFRLKIISALAILLFISVISNINQFMRRGKGEAEELPEEEIDLEEGYLDEDYLEEFAATEETAPEIIPDNEENKDKGKDDNFDFEIIDLDEEE